MTTKYYIKISLLALIMSLAVNFAKAQCNANFTDTSNVCGVVQFTNLSTGTNSTTGYIWSFPQGSPATSTLTNPSTTYTANGTYTVCLQMYNTVPSCSNTICKTITVSCFTSSLCTANFSSSPCSTVGANAQMSFSNTSLGTNSTTVYDWDLGNNTTSTLTSPIGTYTANGTYTVCLTYTTYAPATCSASICKTVSINCVTSTCSANYIDSICVISGTNAQMSFSNTSTGTNASTQYSWNFGNTTTSTATNPIATYTANGIYTVCLSIITPSPPPTCSATICKTVDISCIPPPPTPTCQANFTNTPCNNGQVSFWSTSSGTNSSTTYTWTNSPPPNGPPGPYTATVCLKMVNSSPACTHSVCKTILIDCSVGLPQFIFESGKLRIFPNPSNGLFHLDVNQVYLNSSLQIKVYNILGELVHQSIEEVDQGKLNQEIDLQNLPNGAYYLRMNVGNNAYSVKLIITK